MYSGFHRECRTPIHPNDDLSIKKFGAQSGVEMKVLIVIIKYRNVKLGGAERIGEMGVPCYAQLCCQVPRTAMMSPRSLAYNFIAQNWFKVGKFNANFLLLHC